MVFRENVPLYVARNPTQQSDNVSTILLLEHHVKSFEILLLPFGHLILNAESIYIYIEIG